MTVDRTRLEALVREDLVVEARQVGAVRPEVMTRVELVDEILRLSTPNPVEQKRVRGFLGVARDLIAEVVEKGLNLPDAAAMIRGDVRFEPLRPPPQPVATVTLAEIYGAQGHHVRAIQMLEEVLAKEPEHDVAERLLGRLAREHAGRESADAAPAGPEGGVVAVDLAADGAGEDPTSEDAVESNLVDGGLAEGGFNEGGSASGPFEGAPAARAADEDDVSTGPATIASRPDELFAYGKLDESLDANADDEADTAVTPFPDAGGVTAAEAAAAAVDVTTAAVDVTAAAVDVTAAPVADAFAATVVPVLVVAGSAQDAGIADTQVADTQVADTQVADTQVADTQVADAGAGAAADSGLTPSLPAVVSLFLLRDASNVAVYWELPRPRSRDGQVGARDTDAVVLRVVEVRPSRVGAERLERDILLIEKRGVHRVSGVSENSIVRAAVGYHRHGVFRAVAVAVEVRPSNDTLRPVGPALGAQDRSAALERASVELRQP